MLPEQLLRNLDWTATSPQNGMVFFRRGISRGARTIRSGQWSEELQCRWWTRAPGNFRNHPLLANPLSSLSHIEFPFSKCLAQVNFDPTYPRSMKPHSSITSLNDCIWLWGLHAPPSFSYCLVISLKSPTHNQGITRSEFSCLNLLQASLLLVVSGFP